VAENSTLRWRMSNMMRRSYRLGEFCFVFICWPAYLYFRNFHICFALNWAIFDRFLFDIFLFSSFSLSFQGVFLVDLIAIWVFAWVDCTLHGKGHGKCHAVGYGSVFSAENSMKIALIARTLDSFLFGQRKYILKFMKRVEGWRLKGSV